MRDFKWGFFVLGYALIDVCAWQLSLPLYLGVQLGAVILYISGVL
jgi:hypothetical protein